jgi:16S rRNA (cytidine1402-2'-O)-methyltransferase
MPATTAAVAHLKGPEDDGNSAEMRVGPDPIVIGAAGAAACAQALVVCSDAAVTNTVAAISATIEFLIMNTLYVVATPIGHLSDISQRAISTLREADTICVEDKRVSRVLLDHIGASAELLAVHQHNEMSAIEPVLERLAAGKKVALISDAGTPGISDPGARLVAAARKAGFLVSPIPGPSALASLMSVCGFADHPADTPTLFEGFLPSKAGERGKRLRELSAMNAHVVFYEAPHRIIEMAQALAEHIGEDRQFIVGRELTKRFEQIHGGVLSEFKPWLESNPDHLRGEFVIAVAAPVRRSADEAGDELMPASIHREDLIDILLASMPLSQAVRVAESIAKKSLPIANANAKTDTARWKRQWGKSALYDACIKIRGVEP